MAQLIVRNLDDDVKAKLKLRARRHGRSTEAEVREILFNAVKDEGGGTRASLSSRIAARFVGIGLEDIPEYRGYPVRPADFDS